MIEKILIDYLLNKKIDKVGTDVYLEVPEQKPSTYIILEKTGSSYTDGVRSATFAIQSYSANSLLESAEINESVNAVMLQMPDETEVYSVHLNGDYNYTDTETKEYRYQSVLLIHY